MCFNPILVQFKHPPGRRDVLQAGSFNPILVQFKHETGNRLVIDEMSFNPILVQFKQHIDTARGKLYTQFQSYLSPIQTYKKDFKVFFSVKFQSYLSPIQTIHSHCNNLSRLISFNPILVQFKRGAVDLGWQIFSDVSILSQSNSNRSPAQPSSWRTRVSILSQSNSNRPAIVLTNRHMHGFNPILVQFKPAGDRPDEPPHARFQSYLSPIQTTRDELAAYVKVWVSILSQSNSNCRKFTDFPLIPDVSILSQSNSNLFRNAFSQSPPPSFNPILVQFKHHICPGHHRAGHVSILSQSNSNSRAGFSSENSENCFNPILVQFKPYHPLRGASTSPRVSILSQSNSNGFENDRPDPPVLVSILSQSNSNILSDLLQF